MHDVEVIYENYLSEDYDGEEYEQDEHEEEDKNEEMLETMTTSISKIKIGRIEIFDSRNSSNDPDKNNNISWFTQKYIYYSSSHISLLS